MKLKYDFVDMIKISLYNLNVEQSIANGDL